MPPGHERVGRGHHPPVRRGDHGSVVAWPEQCGGVRAEPGGDPGDEPELAGLRDAQSAPSWVRSLPRTVVSRADARTGRPRRRVVVQAYILIQTEVGKARDVAAAIAQIEGVARVDVVTGPYDVIVLTEAVRWTNWAN